MAASDSPRGVAIVTGGTSCIGAAAVRVLSKSLKVVIADLPDTADEGRALAAELGADAALFLECDVRSEESIDKTFRAAVDHFQLPLAVLVNNAAVCLFGAQGFEDTTMEHYDLTHSTNTRGPFLCTRAAARLMQPQRRGSIINISSIAGLRALPFENPSYSVSKFALAGMTQVAAAKLAPHSIRVNAISPTAIADSLLVHNAIKASGQDPAAMMGMTTRLFATLYPGELTPVGAVADAIDFLASDKSLHITGTDTPVDQGWAAGAVNMPS